MFTGIHKYCQVTNQRRCYILINVISVTHTYKDATQRYQGRNVRGQTASETEK